MAHYNIPVVTIVFNDNAFGNVRRIQTLRFNGHTLATELRNPDLPKLAELFGVAGYRARDAAELRDTLRHALAADRPALIEVPMPPSAELIGVFSHQQEPPRPKLES